MSLNTNLGRCLSHVAYRNVTHTCLVKIHKNVTEQLTSKTVSAQIFFALWTLNPGAVSSCIALIHAIRACNRKQHSAGLFTYSAGQQIVFCFFSAE